MKPYKFQKKTSIQGKTVTMIQNPDVIEEMANKIVYMFLSYPAKITTCCAVLSRSVVSDSLRPQGLQPTRLLCPWGFSRQEHWSGLPCLPPGGLPNPGIESRSPALQANSFPSEPPGSPKITISKVNIQLTNQEKIFTTCITQLNN